MKIQLYLLFLFIIVLTGCEKNDIAKPINQETILTKNTIIAKEINNSLLSIDSTKLTFISGGSGINKISIGSVIVSDTSKLAPGGYLRKVTGISSIGGNIIFTTEQASITDAIVKGEVSFKKIFTDGDIVGIDSSGVDKALQGGRTKGASSFTQIYNEILHDADGNHSTTNDQLKVNGEFKLEPSLNFNLKIKESKIENFNVVLTLKNTNKIRLEANKEVKLKEEIVLLTYYLKPFNIYIGALPIPIASQWIVVVLGVDGSLSAKVSASVQNINTAVAGIVYENNSWTAINTQSNSFDTPTLSFQGAAKIEPWLQARYEIRPYALKSSRIFIGIRGSLIGEATISPTEFTKSLKWAVKFSAKAQIQIIDRTVLNYEKIFFEREFPINSSTTLLAVSTLTTRAVNNISLTSAKSGGDISTDGGAVVTAKGICFSTISNPTILNTKTIDGAGVGSFTSTLSSLTSNTTYYVRAYATNSVGTGYGNEISFKTTSTPTFVIPSLTTNAISGITEASAQSGGNVSSDGGSVITARGVCFNTSPGPTVGNTTTNNGTGIGTFISTLSGLTSNTTYYVKAYATNSVGTAYGNEISFKTTSTGLPTTPSITDIDGNTYSLILIGAQVWMGENLKVSRYNNGQAILAVTDDNTWSTLSSGANCSYNNDQTNVSIYGKLYNWYAVVDSRKLCPVGSHVPSKLEWDALIGYVGGINSGGKLKESGLAHWISPNTDADNSSGFSGLPAGGRQSFGGKFAVLGSWGIWYTSTEDANRVYTISLSSNSGTVNQSYSDKKEGFSVRCIKD
jgi:uncharacterized protein (TIGR02145 family)